MSVIRMLADGGGGRAHALHVSKKAAADHHTSAPHAAKTPAGAGDRKHPNGGPSGVRAGVKHLDTTPKPHKAVLSSAHRVMSPISASKVDIAEHPERRVQLDKRTEAIQRVAGSNSSTELDTVAQHIGEFFDGVGKAWNGYLADMKRSNEKRMEDPLMKVWYR